MPTPSLSDFFRTGGALLRHLPPLYKHPGAAPVNNLAYSYKNFDVSEHAPREVKGQIDESLTTFANFSQSREGGEG